jgi:hypothetical protein
MTGRIGTIIPGKIVPPIVRMLSMDWKEVVARQICGAPATREADPTRIGGVKRDLLNERFKRL